jgi:hypothetical protein
VVSGYREAEYLSQDLTPSDPFQAKAKTYYGKLVVLAQNADIERPELKEAKAFLAKK